MKSTRQGSIPEMNPIILALISFVAPMFRSRKSMRIEIVDLRHQLAVLQRSVKRPRLTPADRILWSWVSRIWPGWRNSLTIVQPATVLAWRRRKFREHWTKLSRNGKPGRPPVSKEIRDLIREMSRVNPLWGSPRIMGELRKVGINVAKSTVEKYMVRHRKPSSPTWRSSLSNHVGELVSIDFFVVPTVDFRLRLRGAPTTQPQAPGVSPPEPMHTRMKTCVFCGTTRAHSEPAPRQIRSRSTTAAMERTVGLRDMIRAGAVRATGH